MISIVTATYNRAHLLPRLYQSLKSQENKDFEWVVIDDGSVDNTESLIMEFMGENLININYIKKNNGGKHTALNMGIQIAKYDYIFFVDSDDFLPVKSVKIIKDKINLIKDHSDYAYIAGVCGLIADFKGNLIGTRLDQDVICNYITYRYKYKVLGDKAEIFKKAVLLDFLFPTFDDEKFCPEALIWNRISEKYTMFFFNEVVYFREYLDGGLTSKIVEIRKKSPKATLLYYYEFVQLDLGVYFNFRGCLNFWRFYYLSDAQLDLKSINCPTGFVSMICRFIIFILYKLGLIF